MSICYSHKLMMLVLTVSLFFASNLSVMGQEKDDFIHEFVFEQALLEDDYFEHFKQYDFAPLWMQTPESSVFGFLGDNYLRIRIKLISVIKNAENPNEYFVYGKSSLKGNICDFQGTITIKRLLRLEELHFGEENVFEDKGIQFQGIVVADYTFFEDGKQAHPGIFKGKLYTKWYVNEAEELLYDFIESGEMGYSNNSYIGHWMLYGSKLKKRCHWGDYRIPLAGDLDKGTTEFEPREEYIESGWKDYVEGVVNGVDDEASARELGEWWK